MVNFNESMLYGWVMSFIFPLIRILAFVSIAPFFGHKSIPAKVKLGLGAALAIIIAPTIEYIPEIDIFSMPGVLLIIEQVIIGFAMGFVVLIIFTGVEMAGQLSGMTMGLGFATFFDPQSRGSTIVIGQLFTVLMVLMLLAIDGHLMMISSLAESFKDFPIGMKGHAVDGMKVAAWGSKIFSIGLHIAMPVISALLITNVALGILTRTAPQLNLFGIGFPITIGVGFAVIAITLNSMSGPLQNFIEQGIQFMPAVLNS